MSSNLFSNLEISLHFFQLAQVLIKENNFSKALAILKISLRHNPDYPIIYFSISKTLHSLNNDIEALEWNNKILETIEKLNNNDMNESIKFNTWSLRFEIIEKIPGTTEKLIQNLNEFEFNLNKDEFIKPKTKQNLIEKTKTKREKLFSICKILKNVSLLDRKAQAKEVYDMIKKAEDLSIFFKNKKPMFIISMNWFKKWKKYCFFHHNTGDHSDKKEELKTFNNEINDTLKSDEEDEKTEVHSHVHPGTIDQKELLELDEEIFIDPDEENNYANDVMKKGLEENKDYIIVNERVWEYLSTFYQGKEIRRIVINVNEKNYFMVEVWLKKIKFAIWPNLLSNLSNPNELKTYSIYVSRKDTVKSFIQKIQRILEYYPINLNLKRKEIRAWKNFDYESFIKSYKIFDEKQLISVSNSILLDGASKFEDAEINEDEMLLVEIKFFSNWTLTSGTTQLMKDSTILKSCSYCKIKKNDLLRCLCSQVFYCNQTCQKLDWKNHSELCKKYRLTPKITDPEKIFTKSSRRGLTGLQNIGNTCFMNSSLQCLSNIYLLTQYFLSGNYVIEINEKNVLGTGGKLARSYANLLEEVWVGDKSHASTWEIKKIIAKLAPQFYGYNQQDSQEFLSYLLDGLHEDLNRVKNKPIVENKENEIFDDEVVSSESWQNYLKRNQSIIVDYFAGQYKSTLVCPDCNKISITFDPFLIASLPIPAIDYTKLSIYFIFREPKKTPIKLVLNLFSFITIETLIKRISFFFKIHENFIELCWIKEHLICDFVDKNTLVKKFKDHDGILFMYEKYKPIPDIQFEEKEFIKTQIQVFSKTSKKEDGQKKAVSFTRLIMTNRKLTFSELHLEIYKLFRTNIKNLYKNASKWTNFHNFFVKYDFPLEEEEEKNPNLISFDQEYKEIFLSEKKDLSAPYTLFILTKKNEKNVNFEQIPFNSNTLDSILRDCLIHEHIKLQIRFEYCIKVEDIKLNICLPENNHQNISDPNKISFTLEECFELFTREEKLDKDNEWYCNKCQKHKQATKKMELYKLPDYLILHLKRFKTSRIGSIGSLYFPAGSTKINSCVEFPIDELDMQCYSKKKNQNSKYELIGICNHFGEMNGGHYTAFCKNNFSNSWFEFDDTRVSKCKNEKEIISEAAYMLFYKKIIN